MRVVIDLQGCQNGSRDRGIGRSSLALAKAMLRQGRQHDIVLLLNGMFPLEAEALLREFQGLVDASRVLVFEVCGPVDEMRAENDSRRIAAELSRERLLAQLAPDAVFMTSMVEGSQDDTVTSVGWVGGPALTVALLHDLIPLHDPNRYIGYPPARRWYMNKVASLRRCDLLLAVSDSARSEALDLLKRSPDDVVTISSSVDDKFINAIVGPEARRRCLSRLGIVRPFLMHAAAAEYRKNFGGLLRAFQRLDPALRREHQLVFVGKFDESMKRELDKIAQEAGAAPDELVLTGHVSDDELLALYASCRLFVYPSLHEGFGLPLLEAMHLDAPVIGSNRTSIPEVIGREDALFDPTNPDSIARKIEQVLGDPRFEQELRSHSLQRRAQFSWDRSARLALEAIETAVTSARAQARPYGDAARLDDGFYSAVTAPPDAPAPEPELLQRLASALAANDARARQFQARHGTTPQSAPMRWRVEGPFDSSYSLALVNREFARALQDLGHSATLHSTEGPGDFEANTEFLLAHGDLADMHARAASEVKDDLDVQGRNLYPPRVSGMSGQTRLLMQYAWEESGLPAAWAEAFNHELHGITCTSEHVRKVLRDNGVELPIAVVGNGVDHWERVQPRRTASFPGKSFRFLHVSSCFPRKGIDALLRAWGEAFDANDDVSLIVKTFSNPHNTVRAQIEAHRRANPRYPDVQVIEGDLDDATLKSLYLHCHVLVAPSRAEGFGLPLAEAMLSGLPVITTAWSGQLDFCNAESAWLVDYRFAAAESHFKLFGSVWADPDVESLKNALLAARATGATERLQRAERGRELLLRHWRWRDVAARSIEAVRSWRAGSTTRVPRIGWVSSWNTRCGLATYSRYLVEAFAEPVTVFAPREPRLERPDETFVRRCWRSNRQEESSLQELSEALVAEGIDTLVLQFSMGFFRPSVLARFIERQVDDERSVVVMLHATADPPELARDDPEWRLSTLAPALARCDRVVVHTLADLNRLKRLGLVDNVMLMPHPLWRAGTATLEAEPHEPAQASPSAHQPEPESGAGVVIATFGFCLPHKGLSEVLDAVLELKRQGFPVSLRMLNAEFPAASSAALVRQLRERVDGLSSELDVSFESGFLDDAEVEKRLRAADLVVFAYQDTQESASGAVRHALAARRPVLVTPMPIFDDLGDAVHRCERSDAAAIATAVRRVLSPAGAAEREATQARATLWREAHDVGRLASRFESTLKGLWIDRARKDTCRFDGSSRMLRTVAGLVDKRSLVTSGQAGLWVAGPDLPLRSGRHRLTLDWEGRCPSGTACEIRVVCDGESTSLARTMAVPAGAARHEFEIVFDNPAPTADLAILIEVPEGALLRLHGVELKRVGAAGAATAMHDSHNQAGTRRNDPVVVSASGEELAP